MARTSPIAATLRQSLVLLALALVPALAAMLWHPHRPAWSRPAVAEGEVSLATVRAWPSGTFLWVDARPKVEHDRGTIPGAVLLNEDDWSALLFASLEQLAAARRVVVFCGAGCASSHKVAQRLKAESITPGEVWVLHEGWEGWREEKGVGALPALNP